MLVSLSLVSREALAAPRPLDRIVAVVDQSPILLSEVRSRLRPILAKLAEDAKRPPTEAEIAAAQRELLERIIDERVFAVDPETRSIEASAAEVDGAIQEMAKAAERTPDAVYADVRRYGMTREAFRAEVRRQLVDARWMIGSIRPRVRVSVNDDAAYARALAEERAKALARLRAAHFVEVRSR